VQIFRQKLQISSFQSEVSAKFSAKTANIKLPERSANFSAELHILSFQLQSQQTMDAISGNDQIMVYKNLRDLIQSPDS
jgi:hypothetical protein